MKKYILFSIILSSTFCSLFAQTWQSIGPFGGDRHFIYQNPHNHNTFYTGGMGFVHRTTDGGETWNSLTDDPELGQIGFEAVIVSYSDSNKILTNSKSGMFLSTDKGQSWNLSNTGLSQEKKATTFVSFHSSPNYVFAGIGVKDISHISQGGVYFSNNFGKTWQSKNEGLVLTKTTRIYSSNTDDLYACTLGAGLFKFDTISQSWSPLGNFNDSITCIKIDPRNDSVLIVGTYSNWLFLSQDKGLTWSQLQKPNQLSGNRIPATCWDIEFDPQNPNVIYTRLYSGQEIPWYQNANAASMTKGTFYSIDGGNTWTQLNSGSFTDMLVDGFSSLTDSFPKRSSGIFITGGGGNNIKRSNDGGVSFQIKNNGIATTLVNRVTVDKYGRVFIGAEAGAALLRNIQGIQSKWQFLNISPKAERIGYNWQMVVAPEDSGTVYFCKGEFSHYSNVGKGIYKYNINSKVDGTVLPGTKYNGFMYLTCGNTSDTIYAGSHSSGVWMSIDKGNNWTKYETGLNEKMIQTFYVSKITRLPLYCVTRLDSIHWSKSVSPDSGGFYKWDNNFEKWELKTKGLGSVVASDMKVSPFDENKIYISTFNNGIFKSTDGGNNWTNISPTALVKFKSRVIEINPNNDEDIFIGTNKGIWESEDGGKNWKSLNFPGLKSLTINDIAISTGGDIFIAETGGSVQYIPQFILGIEDYQNSVALIRNYPNPFHNFTTIEFNNKIGEIYTLQLFNDLGQNVRTISNIMTNKIILKRENLKSGMYFFQIISSGKQIYVLGKMIIE